MKLLLLAALAAWEACPYFSEILPDPQEVEDARGEFAEIRLPEKFRRGTLSVVNEQKKVWSGIVSDTVKRILLIRDTSLCPLLKGLLCRPLTGTALPNSREAMWTLSSPSCADTAKLPIPKAGESFVRSGEAFDAWEWEKPSPGIPNGIFEKGIADCHLNIDTLIYAENGWRGEWTLSGCDSAEIDAKFSGITAFAEKEWRGTLFRGVRSPFFTYLTADAFHLTVKLPEDDVPGNDFVDSLFAKPGAFPVRFTEVHPCPEEGMPEWIEIYNPALREVSLAQMSSCKDKTQFPSAVSIQKHESIVLAKDTAAMRLYVGNSEVKILPVNFGYLKNAADSLYLCYGKEKVDSVFWGKLTQIQPKCPAGFAVASGRSEDSPGFQTPGSLARDTALPFQVEWNARVFSRKKSANPLMVRIRSELSVTVELISGKGDLLWKKELPAEASGNAWTEIPLLQKGFPGANFLRFSAGSHEKRVGVVLRP